MPRFRLTIEYDGRPFFGWQYQDNLPTVQGALQGAAKQLCGEDVVVYGAGRTDTGVHATGQVAHVDLPKAYAVNRLRDAFNALLRPAPIAVLEAMAVPDEFHARLSATERLYRYDLTMRRAPITFETGLLWRVGRPLDVEAMRAATDELIGTHDFSTFRDADCQAKSPVKTLDEIVIAQDGERLALFFRARSFLHSQVRSMVGSLVEVGLKRWNAADLAKAREARHRQACGRVAPPDGLYLTAVRY